MKHPPFGASQRDAYAEIDNSEFGHRVDIEQKILDLCYNTGGAQAWRLLWACANRSGQMAAPNSARGSTNKSLDATSTPKDITGLVKQDPHRFMP